MKTELNFRIERHIKMDWSASKSGLNFLMQEIAGCGFIIWQDDESGELEVVQTVNQAEVDRVIMDKDSQDDKLFRAKLWCKARLDAHLTAKVDALLHRE